jgi:uncharacterized FlaG/YvyC family protein
VGGSEVLPPIVQHRVLSWEQIFSVIKTIHEAIVMKQEDNTRTMVLTGEPEECILRIDMRMAEITGMIFDIEDTFRQ